MALPSAALGCPRCSAHLRPGAPWCTQCFLELRAPADEPAPVRASAPTPVQLDVPELDVPELDDAELDDAGLDAAGLDDAELDDAELDAPRWPCTACRTRNLLSATACSACGLAFLGGLHDGEPPLLGLPLVGDLGRLSGAQRLGVAAAVVLAVMLLTALVGLLTA